MINQKQRENKKCTQIRNRETTAKTAIFISSFTKATENRCTGIWYVWLYRFVWIYRTNKWLYLRQDAEVPAQTHANKQRHINYNFITRIIDENSCKIIYITGHAYHSPSSFAAAPSLILWPGHSRQTTPFSIRKIRKRWTYVSAAAQLAMREFVRLEQDEPHVSTF